MNDVKEFKQIHTIYIEREKSVLALLESKRAGSPGTIAEIINRLLKIGGLIQNIASHSSNVKGNSLILLISSVESLNHEMEYLLNSFSEQVLHRFKQEIVDSLIELRAITISIFAGEEKNRNFEELLSKYKGTVERLEIDTNILDFKAAANEFNKRGNIWLVVVAFVFVGLLAATFYFFSGITGDVSQLSRYIELNKNNEIVRSILFFEIFKLVFVKLLLVSVLVFTLRFAISNYSAAMHNRTVNQHKGNSLTAAERMIRVLGYDNVEVRNHILILASKEIFVQEKTGYLSKEDKVDFSVIEKLASIGKKES